MRRETTTAAAGSKNKRSSWECMKMSVNVANTPSIKYNVWVNRRGHKASPALPARNLPRVRLNP